MTHRSFGSIEKMIYLCRKQMEPMINNGDNRKEKRIISEPTPVDLWASMYMRNVTGAPYNNHRTEIFH